MPAFPRSAPVFWNSLSTSRRAAPSDGSFVMDFAIPPDLGTLQDRTRDFIRGSIVPLEKDSRQTRHGPSDALRRELNAMAAGEGLLAPHVSSEFGGLGLSHFGKAVV